MLLMYIIIAVEPVESEEQYKLVKHAGICIYTYITYICIYLYTHTYLSIYHTWHIHMYSYVSIYASSTMPLVHICIHTYLYMCKFITYMHTYIPTIDTYIHTYWHAFTHMYIVHIYSSVNKLDPFSSSETNPPPHPHPQDAARAYEVRISYPATVCRASGLSPSGIKSNFRSRFEFSSIT